MRECLNAGAGEKFVSEAAWCRLNRLVLGKLLSKLGYEVVYGTNGVEAVQQFSQSMTAKRDEQDGLFCILMVRFPSCGPALSLDLYLLQWLVRALKDRRRNPRWYCMHAGVVDVYLTG